MNNLLNLILSSICLVCTFSFSNGQMGPGIVTLLDIQKCAEDDGGLVIDLVGRQGAELKEFDATVDAPYDFDDNVQLNVSLDKKEDGAYSQHLFDHFEPEACSFMVKYAEKQFYEILRNNNLPEQCPVAKGKYQMKNYKYKDDPGTNVMYGEFKIDMRIIRENVQMTCMSFFILSEPKE